MITAEALKVYAGRSSLRESLGIPRGASLEFSRLGAGEYNDNWLFVNPETGRRLVLRLNMGSQMRLERQIDYEYNALKLLEPSGRTPRALWLDGGKTALPYGVLVMEWLPGKALDYGKDLSEAAAILADIHSVNPGGPCGLLAPADPLAAMFDECSAMLGVYLGSPHAPEAVKRRLLRMKERARRLLSRQRAAEARCVVNTELNSGNFLISGGAPGFLVDWEKPLWAPAVQDLAHFLAPTTTFWKTDVIFSRPQMNAFLGEYAARSGRESSLESFEDCLLMTCLRGVTWCAMAWEQYRGGGKELLNDFTRRKISDYLSDPFLSLLEGEFFGL